MAEPELAIIGGGASSVILLAQIAEIPQMNGMRIDVYDRSERFGRGVAYSTQHKAHLLNVRAANMSAFPHKNDDFSQWAAQHGYTPLSFVPRMMFGDYLCEKLEIAKSRLSLNLITADVLSARKAGSSYEIETDKRKNIYPCTILATGNVKSNEPRLDAKIIEGYHSDPYKADYSAMSDMEHIVLIGSGLTAVDAVLALFAKNYKGRITIISRHGLLPAPHIPHVPYDQLPEDGYVKASPYMMMRLLRAHAKLAAANNQPWQGVIDALRPHTNIIWDSWTRLQREKFMKRLYTIWNVHRHRMAPEIAEAVNLLRRGQRLDIVKDNVEVIGAGPIVVTGKERYMPDAVINCMGYRYKEDGRSFDTFGRMGPAAFGPTFETTAIPEIREQAAELVKRLLERY